MLFTPRLYLIITYQTGLSIVSVCSGQYNAFSFSLFYLPHTAKRILLDQHCCSVNMNLK